MRTLFFCCLAMAALTGWGKTVGTFDDSRTLVASYDLVTGVDVSLCRAAWEARGAVWQQTDLITPAFLSGVDVFITGLINQDFQASEVGALVAWTKAGGTLIVTAECT